MPLDELPATIDEKEPRRVPGTAVYMSSNPDGTPHALVHNLEHNKIIHERVVTLTVETLEVPYADEADRIEVDEVAGELWSVILRYGFSEDPNVHRRLVGMKLDGDPIDADDVTYFLGRERLIPTEGPGMAIWREKLFAFMSRNATNATDYFRIPSDKVVELGLELEI